MTGPNLPVPEPVQTASKAISAAWVTAGGVIALFVTSVADGSISWDEGGKLIGAVVVAATAIGAVWRTRNKPRA